ncbi:MAG: 50S ribosomal protein L9 [Myxococcota bacterium]|jgi:large subunit ribosomal protein L9|nr:50S ribosomal protein L9 [Myxococcota bacterium]
MRVILTEDVPNVGDMGTIVRVADGFGRNFLIPRGLALPATEGREREFKHQLAQVEKRKALLREQALGAVGKLQGVSVTIPRQAGDNDKLYGAVTNRDVQAALAAEGHEVDRRAIELSTPIKELGIHKVWIRLHAEVRTFVKVWVTAV